MSNKRGTRASASIVWLGCAGIALGLLVISTPQALFAGDVVPAIIWGMLSAGLGAGGVVLRREP